MFKILGLKNGNCDNNDKHTEREFEMTAGIRARR